jgi:hypothetical protein
VLPAPIVTTSSIRYVLSGPRHDIQGAPPANSGYQLGDFCESEAVRLAVDLDRLHAVHHIVPQMADFLSLSVAKTGSQASENVRNVEIIRC